MSAAIVSGRGDLARKKFLTELGGDDDGLARPHVCAGASREVGEC
jgi:hypothetical protein